MLIFCLIFFGTPGFHGTGQVQGTVRDASSNEPLALVSIRLLQTEIRVRSDRQGRFALHHVAPGDYTLQLITVGFRLHQERIHIGDRDAVNLDVALSPETSQHKDAVPVVADPFDLAREGGPTGFTLTGSEIKNLSTVLADDPLRGLQAAPGVALNDDFDDRFTLHGAPYSRVGLYLDGILLHQPFHTVQGEGPSGSLSIVNGDFIDTMTLESEAYPARYGDRTAGVLDVQTREGDKDKPHYKVTISAPDAALLGEGPLGKSHKGSWLVSVRKSYLQYFLERTSSDTGSLAFGFLDTQGILSYNLNASNHLSMRVFDGTSDFDRSAARSMLPLNSSMRAGFRSTLLNLGWQYTPSSSFLVNTHAGFIRERFDDTNTRNQLLAHGFYGEWAANSDATWMWGKDARFQFGASGRTLRDDGGSYYYDTPARSVEVVRYQGSTPLTGTYLQQLWTGLNGRLLLSAGLRFDHLNTTRESTWSPQASVAVLPTASSRLELSWGQYAQFPDVQELFSEYSAVHLQAERSTHYVASWEQRLGEMARFRVQAYRRQDSDLVFRPTEEARLSGNTIIPDNYMAPYMNSLHGMAQGLEFFIQKRTANGLTGWASYSFGHTEVTDTLARIRFPSDEDQRHTLNVYLSSRIRPSLNLSTKWMYGSGFPIPGFFKKVGDTYYISSDRNQTRLPSYQRLDVRINKSYVVHKHKMTVYGEVVNLLNRANYRFDSYNGYNSITGQAYLSFAKMFPVLPSAGLSLDF